MRLAGKVAIITGAGLGIGRAAARLFAREGARVVVAEVVPDAGWETVNLIKQECGQAIFVHMDVSNSADCSRMIQATMDAFGKVDILYNNAGVHHLGNVLTTSEELWDHIMAVNLKGTFLCSQAALPAMALNPGGVIINTSSGVGHVIAGPNSAAYSASKAGVAMLTRAMALDHAKDHVRVNCICPGPTMTPLMERSFSGQELTTFQNHLPMQRLGTPEEIAQSALWLASDEASFVTGAIIAVDGGRTCGWSAWDPS